MILAIDAGNTRVKWGVHDGSAWRLLGGVTHGDVGRLAAEWQHLPEPAHIIVSNVGGERIRIELLQLFSRWRKQPRWLVARSYEAGVTNGYADPAQLGSDRWAALIAARARCSGACVVIDAGTAVTVDALSAEGKFLGGIILPGPELMQASLAGGTAAIKSGTGAFASFPTNTADGVYSGALQALAGAVERMASALAAAAGCQPQLIISGGAAPLLRQTLNMQVQVVDNLVLEGLVGVAQS